MLWLVPVAMAAEIRRGDNVIVPASEIVNDDLYVIAQAIRIDGVVTGDAVLVGRTIQVDGQVDGDVIAVGRQVTLSGGIADDLRAASANLELRSEGRVGGDLLAAGGRLQTQPGSEVGSAALLSVRHALLQGRIGGDLVANVTTVRLDGPVGGSVRARVRGSALPLPHWWKERLPGLVLGPRAEVDGVLAYQAPQPAHIEPGARLTGPVEGSVLAVDRSAMLWAAVRRFVGLLLVGAIAVLVAPRFIGQAADIVARRLLPSLGVGAAAILGWGFTLILVVMVVSTLAWLFGFLGFEGLSAFVVAAGGLAGVALLVILLLALGWLAQATVALAIGERLVHNRIAALVLGLLLVAVLSAIPVVGAAVGIAIALLGLGGMVLAVLRSPAQEQRLEEAPTAGG